MDKQQMRMRIIEQLCKLEDVAFSELGVPVPDYEIQWNLRGRTAGYAWKKDGVYFMKFNLDIAINNPDTFSKTVIHEFAHIMTFIKFPRASSHGMEWKYVMRKLGIMNPERCHNYKGVVPARKVKKFSYTCSGCNRDYEMGIVRHNRQVDYGKDTGRSMYRCGRCHSDLTYRSA